MRRTGQEDGQGKVDTLAEKVTEGKSTQLANYCSWWPTATLGYMLAEKEVDTSRQTLGEVKS